MFEKHFSLQFINMRNTKILKIVKYSLTIFVILLSVLAVHICWVYTSKKSDPNTKVLARIDIHQPIQAEDSARITSWMYHQRGVDHVLVNPKSRIVVFTFFPKQVDANMVVGEFRRALKIEADRRLPTAEELKHSCPVSSSSFTYKVVQLINRFI